MADAFSSFDVSIKAAGESPLGAVGRIALGYANSGEPSADAAQLRAELESGQLADEKGTGIGAKADHSV